MDQVKKGNVLTLRMADGNVIQLERYDTLTSTANLAREYARNGYPDKYVIFAENQCPPTPEEDRGKKGKAEHGIFMSCILRPSFFPSQAAFLGIMTAVSMIEALEEHTERRLGLGWVSDVYCEGKVIAHSSIEGKLDSHFSYEYLIVSFHILLDDENFPPRMADIVRKVFESDGSSIPMIIGKNVLSKFFSRYPYVKTPDKFIENYRRRFLLRGLRTKLVQGTKKVRCRILGVDPETAQLIVELGSGEVKKIPSRSQIILPEKIRLKKNKSNRRA